MFVRPIHRKKKKTEQIVVTVDKNQLTYFLLLQGGEFNRIF